MEHIADHAPRLQEKANDIQAAQQEIKILRAESSPLLQARIKVGGYSHFYYNGINRNYIARPTIGFKYYLFGGNKYLRHITAQAQPAYYHTLERYDAISRKIKRHIAISYIAYWQHYETMHKLIHLLKITAHWNRRSKVIHGILSRVRLSMYLAHMRARIALHRLIELVGRSIPSFVPLRPRAPIEKKVGIAPSTLRLHPAIMGLIRYYHDQNKLGWLRFVNTKLKLFARPSYYPSAGRTKMAVIGGVYLDMPLDIMSAEHHADQQLALERENIMLKLKDDAIRARQEHRISETRLPIYRRETIFWKKRARHWWHVLRVNLHDIHAGNHHDLRGPQITRAIRAYREATGKWIHATAHLALIRWHGKPRRSHGGEG